ncbi:S-layer homology domain-containing protein [Marivirga sp. S37H4]|uniref:S-layer homology domain-containing protein n=1 Tax=Marivirga aurantiaca TaxID=2802615 RepID=A0A934X047_9BACT|nr:S-layer homology domain-containing protein [Marivirga aurantiaca]MBK6265940.1 S-layer homology domain-containing protein [Marivirga aurantiaca]
MYRIIKLFIFGLVMSGMFFSCNEEFQEEGQLTPDTNHSLRTVPEKDHGRTEVEHGQPPLNLKGLAGNEMAKDGGNKLGMWLWYLEGTGYSSHDALGRDLAALGVKRIYVKVGDGTNHWSEMNDQALVNTYKSHGLEVWAWAYNYPGNEVTQADAIYYSARAGYQGFVTDIEIEFDGTSTALHSIFKEFRNAITDAKNDGHATSAFKLYCTTWGNPKDHGMRVDIIDQYVDGHMPQTYLEVWGNSYMDAADYWIKHGTQEYKDLGCTKPVHHILSAEHNQITSSQLNEAIAASGAESSIWRIPGGGTSLDIWYTLENVNWTQQFGGSTDPVSDISGHWAEKEIQALINGGYLKGYSDGTFRPDQSMTRAEFATMISATLNPAIKSEYENRNFNDISTHWAKDNILKVARAGYLAGYSDGTFRPDERILKYQMLLALANGYGISGYDTNLLNYFSDGVDIPDWAKQGVVNAAGAGLIHNYPTVTTLQPSRNGSRAEAVTALYQLMTKNGTVSPLNNAYRAVPNTNTTIIQDVPYFYQLANSYNGPGSCQNTSLAMVLNYYGGNVTPDILSNYYGTDKAQTVAGLEDLFNKEAVYMGLDVRIKGTEFGSLTKMNESLAAGKPVIAHGYTTGYGHILVFVGFDGTYYYANDPFGKWDQVAYSSGYVNTSTAGKYIKYHKDAVKAAFAPDGYIWMHEIYSVVQ